MNSSLRRHQDGLLRADDLLDLFGLDADSRWQDQALCAQVDPEIMYPEKGVSARPAKRICASCPVKAECLSYALDHDERFGVWGGTTEHERRLLRRPATTAPGADRPPLAA